MTYFTGKIGVSEGAALISMLILPNIYLSEPSLSIGFVGNSAWLLKILSGILAAVILLVLVHFYQNYIEKFHGGKVVDFRQFIEGLVGRKSAVMLLTLWSILFEIQTILTLREFADHTLITALQTSGLLVIVLLFASCITVAMFRGLEVILRAAYIFFILAAIGVAITILGLYNAYDVNNLLPWRGYGLIPLAKHSVSDIGTWFLGMAILVVAPNLQNIRTIRRSIICGIGYVIALKAVLVAAIIMVFNIVVAPERALLFYEIVQAINLSQYLQRVDSIFIILWLTGGLISTMLMQFIALTLICQAFDIRDVRPVIPVAVLMSAMLALIPNSVGAVIHLNSFFVYYIASTVTLLNFVVLAIGYFLKCRRNASCVGDTK